jgi:hypothetical protein
VKLLKLVKNDKNAKQLFEMTGEGATSSVLEDIKHSYRILQLLCRCSFKIMYDPVDNPHNHGKKRSGQVQLSSEQFGGIPWGHVSDASASYPN